MYIIFLHYRCNLIQYASNTNLSLLPYPPHIFCYYISSVFFFSYFILFHRRHLSKKNIRLDSITELHILYPYPYLYLYPCLYVHYILTTISYPPYSFLLITLDFPSLNIFFHPLLLLLLLMMILGIT